MYLYLDSEDGDHDAAAAAADDDDDDECYFPNNSPSDELENIDYMICLAKKKSQPTSSQPQAPYSCANVPLRSCPGSSWREAVDFFRKLEIKSVRIHVYKYICIYNI